MNYIISANTNIGIKKSINQDNLTVKLIDTPMGQMVFAIMCDGMGGLQKGEVASATIVRAFIKWLDEEFPYICNKYIEDDVITKQWEYIIELENYKIKKYAIENNINLGTTVTISLITNDRYYVLNIGDTRFYEIQNGIFQITEDQTLVTNELKNGRITAEQAAVDPRRNILLQCVGASKVLVPEMYYGKTKKNVVYMLCTDGFRNKISEYELYSELNPELLTDIHIMKNNTEYLINLNKERKELDNMSVILIRTY